MSLKKPAANCLQARCLPTSKIGNAPKAVVHKGLATAIYLWFVFK